MVWIIVVCVVVYDFFAVRYITMQRETYNFNGSHRAWLWYEWLIALPVLIQVGAIAFVYFFFSALFD